MEVVFHVGGFILKRWQEVSGFIVAGLTRMFSVPWGHSVFNGTQLTIYCTRHGRLTWAKTPSNTYHLCGKIVQSFSRYTLVFCMFFISRNHDATPTEKGEFFPL